MNIEIQELENIHSIEMDEEENQPFSWKDELEQIEKAYIKAAGMIEERVNGTQDAVVRIETEENNFFVLNCSIQMGIQVVETDHPEAKGAIFESFESLLLFYSPRYNQIFEDMC